MKANTALCFLASGIAMWRLGSTKGKLHADTTTALLLSFVAVLALASLLESEAGCNFGIDEFLVRDQASKLLRQPPGRMSVATSFSFLCLSIGLLLIENFVLSAILCLAGLAVALIALVGFLYEKGALYTVTPFSTMALHTAMGFLLEGLGFLTLRSESGMVPLLSSPYADVARTRPLLLEAILLPPCLGFLCLRGRLLGWYPEEFAVDLLTVLLVIGSSLLLWWTSRTGSLIDQRRRQTEAALRAQTEELTISNTALEQYAFAAAHDLQEPLRMISLYSQKLTRDSGHQLGPEGNYSLEVLQVSARRISSLVTDLLLHSRILADKEETFAEVEIQEVLREATSNLADLIAATGAKITVEELPAIRGDYGQLLHMFQNLIENSIKYRKPGVAPLVQVSAKRDGMNWVFSVVDNGIGIPMQYAKQIFGVFKRLHGQEIPGTGIGLAICNRVSERHGGRIWVDSQPGDGSTFYVALPAFRSDREIRQASDRMPA